MELFKNVGMEKLVNWVFLSLNQLNLGETQDGGIDKHCAASLHKHIKVKITLYSNHPGEPPEV